MYSILIEQAKKAMENAYAPYSGYKVGAAVKDCDGNIYTGCNIENASYGATLCGERMAIFKAVSEGSRKISVIAVTSQGSMPYPCGMCRQVMTEFMDEDGIILLEHKGNVESYTLKELMPYAFKF